MAKDLVYVFDKLTKKSSLLGEIQSDFNMSLVIDGTKDSTTILVWSYSGVEIEPYSIILHKKTMSWWCVSHDKVERYQNDDGDFVYVHNLELLGAIELLNARDLTDCGFNDKWYRVNEFINRLFELSNVEYPLTISAESNFLNKVVDFIKTFENYTLLSALREFLDAYNMCPKLTFGYSYNSTTDIYTLTDITLRIIPKTGVRSRVHQMSEFDDVRETKTMDKNSFGTCVVSNAESVTSSTTKTFPSTGSTKLSGEEYSIVGSNAVLRLPSKVYKMNWLKCYLTYQVTLRTGTGESAETNNITVNVTSDYSLENVKTQVHHYINISSELSAQEKAAAIASFDANWLNIKPVIIKAGTISFYNGNSLNPISQQIVKGNNVPYIPKISFSIGSANKDYHQVILADKETRDCLPYKEQGIYWERGSNLIKGFDFIKTTAVGGSTPKFTVGYVSPNQSTDLQIQGESAMAWEFRYGANNYIRASLGCYADEILLVDTNWVANYYPMADLKIKIDNQRDKKDIQLYNQNGKITDCVALSKLLNSYSKEISSDTITKYMHYYYSQGSFFGVVPNVGDIVIQGNDEYVINNISIDFTQNETSVSNDFGYFVECEITMSKWVSTKSLMVNPNTNIRDYGIPQNYNVKRKQLYRDYYELSYSAYSDADNNPYLATNKIFDFAHTPNIFDDFIAVMKIGYRNQVQGSSNWYYQLETTNYYLNKMLCVMLDFQDNNIIGYGSQNVFSGFDVSRIFSGMTDNINTPISYVDDAGQFVSISIKLLTNEQITYIYDTYQQSQVGGSSYQGTLYNYSVFIPHEIYDLADPTNYSILIDEPSYWKDALEVPVFEYACQIDDSEDVLVGDDILKQYEGDYIYFYSYIFGNNLNQNNVFTTTRTVTSENIISISFSTTIEYESLNSETKLLRIKLYDNTTYDNSNDSWSNNTPKDFNLNYDYAFFRHAYNKTTGEETVELLFITKKIPYTNVSLDGKILTLQLNHYKLN